jgi:hypothetical protein
VRRGQHGKRDPAGSVAEESARPRRAPLESACMGRFLGVNSRNRPTTTPLACMKDVEVRAAALIVSAS